MKIEIDNGSGFCSGVTTAIKKAEEDAKDKEAKEKELAEAKKELTENYDNLAKLVNTKLDVLAEYKKTIATLEAAVKDAQTAVNPVEKKIAEIKESLESDMLTAEQKASFQTQLDVLVKAKEDYAAALKIHQDRLDVVEKDVNDTEAVLLKLKDDITAQKDKVAALTIDDDLAAAKATYQSMETLEKATNPATDVEKDLAEIKEDLDKLSLESTTKDLTRPSLADRRNLRSSRPRNWPRRRRNVRMPLTNWMRSSKNIRRITTRWRMPRRN